MSTEHRTEAERIVAQIRAEAYEECARVADEYAKAQMAAAFRMDVNFPHNGNRYVAADAAHYLANTIRKAAKGGAA
jgi:hypothetical protein